ncbi:MAG: glycerol-3-phosphate 1-O-acyltransferase PlsY [Vicinamibacterales bacterium]
MTDFLAIAVAYLLGSFPTGFVLTRVVTGQDLRTLGSGATGATNARRALGSKWGVVVALIDVLKGLAAVLIARWVSGEDLTVALAGIAVIVGHCWPIWLGFRGGKGIATGAGVALGFSWWGLLLVPILIVPVALTRYVSVGSLIAAASAPLIFGLLAMTGDGPIEYLVTALIAGIVIIGRHRENIERLRAGTERRLTGRPGTSGNA